MALHGYTGLEKESALLVLFVVYLCGGRAYVQQLLIAVSQWSVEHAEQEQFGGERGKKNETRWG